MSVPRVRLGVDGTSNFATDLVIFIPAKEPVKSLIWRSWAPMRAQGRRALSAAGELHFELGVCLHKVCERAALQPLLYIFGHLSTEVLMGRSVLALVLHAAVSDSLTASTKREPFSKHRKSRSTALTLTTRRNQPTTYLQSDRGIESDDIRAQELYQMVDDFNIGRGP